MVKKLGILGCQSKHAEFFGSLFNTEKAFPGYQVHYLFGDDEPERLPYVQRTAVIPAVCHSADELIDQSEVVLITYREGQRHFAPAMACLNQSKPVFIDKPFTLTPDEAQALIEKSIEKHVPVLGGSTLCFDPQIEQVSSAAHTSHFGTIAYRADAESPFGGYRFYGSHLTDLCATLFGANAQSVEAFRFGDAVSTCVVYPNRFVTLYSQPDLKAPTVIMDDRRNLKKLTLDDERCYFNGMQAFVRLLEAGKPDNQKLNELAFSVRLLEAILQSLTQGGEIQLI